MSLVQARALKKSYRTGEVVVDAESLEEKANHCV